MDEKIVSAHAACGCPSADGISVSCRILALPKLSIVPTGPHCLVSLPEFVCPRHDIMGW